jgi:hypothetical protein
VARRTRDLLDLVDVIPSSVVPHQVDRSVDDLAERIARIKSVEDAIAFLQGLGDGDASGWRGRTRHSPASPTSGLPTRR